MNIAELVDSLPNGFHDAELLRTEVDFVKRTACLHLDLLVGLPDGTSDLAREGYRTAKVTVDGLRYLAIDAPDRNHGLDAPLAVTFGLGEPPGQRRETQQLQSGESQFWFYAAAWNSYIQIAGGDTRLDWSGDPRLP